MKKNFYKKVLPAIISISMVLAICVPNVNFDTAYGEGTDNSNTETVQPEETTPDVPDTDVPENPGNQENPGNPDNPGTPENPDNPGTPDDPGTPDTPDVPDKPDVPDVPDQPGALINVNSATVTLAKKAFPYTGTEHYPAVKVVYQGEQMVKDVDYTVTYINAKYPGTATAVVKGIGRMTGKKNLKYSINLPTTKITKITTPGYQMHRVYWDKVEDVSGYYIYRSTEKNGEYWFEANVAQKYDNWTDKDCKINETYYYKIRTFKNIDGKRYLGPMSNSFTKKSKLLAPKNINAKGVDYDAIYITWDTVKGATGYVVFRSRKPDGDFRRIGTAIGSANDDYKDTGLSLGVKYYYKVAAYKDNKEEPGFFSGYRYGTPKLGAAKWDRDGIKKYKTKVALKWHKVNGAGAYEVYRYSKSQNKYVLRKRVNGKYTGWTDKDLDMTSKYSYKVRPYSVIDGKRIYGGFSDVYKKVPHGWVEKNGLKLYYNKNGNLVKDLRVMLGRQPSYWIKVNKQMNVVNVFARDGSGKYKIPVVAFRCSSGRPTPIGTFYTPAKYRWHELMGPSWGQWNTRIHEGFLFHSVYYLEKNNNKSLPVNTYNRLGQTESHGCVRLRAGDAKWIFDNCALGTKVTIYKSPNPGPYGKPALEKLPYWHTWDPTDPTAFKYCRAHHCHGK